MSLTEPKISSITVSVFELELWEENWLEVHREHSDPGSGDETEPSLFLYGEVADPSCEEESGLEQLLRCCGEARPRGKVAKLVVKPVAEEQGFITSHDYVSAVHSWLMSIRGDILMAMGVFGQPVPREGQIMVECIGLRRLMFE